MPPKRSTSVKRGASKRTVSDTQEKSEPKPTASKTEPTKALKRARGDSNVVNEAPAKKTKISHHSHYTKPGGVYTVGEGDVGQLGLGPDVMERSRAAHVTIGKPCVEVVAGGMHTVCLTQNGQVYTFGCNDEGALGRDTNEEDSESTPAVMDNFNEKVVQISAGDSHTAMLTESGEIYACGTFRDANGSIGLTVDGPQKTPMRISEAGQRFVKIASGSDHIVALTEDGRIFSVGCAEQGQLGRVAECFATRGGRKGLSLLLNFSEVKFRGPRKNRHPTFEDVWAGTYVTFVRSSLGNIFAWGLNNYFQLGLPNDMENKFIPTLVPTLSPDKKWSSIAGGQHHTIAANNDGDVYVFGRGTYGQLGLGEDKTEDHDIPTRLESLPDKCTQVEASSSVSFSLSESGNAYAWGMGTSKQLCNGSEDDEFEPKKMTGKQLEGKKVLIVSSGGQHTALLATDA